MGVGLLIGLIFLLFLLISTPIIFWYFKKRGKTKTGLSISLIILFFVLSIVFSNQIESFTHSKKDTRNDLKLANIELRDDFEIIENDVSGMPERFQKTKLKISSSDKNRILTEIIHSKDFKNSNETRILQNQMWDDNQPRNKIVSANYKFQNEFIRESYFRENEYVPILTLVYLNKETNVIEYEKIED